MNRGRNAIYLTDFDPPRLAYDCRRLRDVECRDPKQYFRMKEFKGSTGILARAVFASGRFRVELTNSLQARHCCRSLPDLHLK